MPVQRLLQQQRLVEMLPHFRQIVMDDQGGLPFVPQFLEDGQNRLLAPASTPAKGSSEQQHVDPAPTPAREHALLLAARQAANLPVRELLHPTRSSASYALATSRRPGRRSQPSRGYVPMSTVSSTVMGKSQSISDRCGMYAMPRRTSSQVPSQKRRCPGCAE